MAHNPKMLASVSDLILDVILMLNIFPIVLHHKSKIYISLNLSTEAIQNPSHPASAISFGQNNNHENDERGVQN